MKAQRKQKLKEWRNSTNGCGKEYKIKTPMIYEGMVHYDRILNKWCGEFFNLNVPYFYDEDLDVVYNHLQNTVKSLVDDGVLPDVSYEVKLHIPAIVSGIA